MRILISILLLCLTTAASAAVLRTNDGLALELADDGQIAGLSSEAGRFPILPGEGGGFYVVDRQATPDASPSIYVRAPLLADRGVQSQKQRFDDLGLTVEVSCASAGDYLSFSGKLTDHTGRDRAIEAGFEIPLQANGWIWSDDVRRRRRADEPAVYRSAYPCPAGLGYSQVYPFSSLAKGTVGLSLGVPLSQGPRVCCVEYDNARRRFAVRFHLGLSPQVKQHPGQAWFSFMLYSHDGAWGLRSAAERYYHLFPGDFEKRVPYEGYLGYAHAETGDGASGSRGFYGVPAFGDFGRGFQWFWHGQQAEPLAAFGKSLEDAIAGWSARQPKREPFTWTISTDGAGAVGTRPDLSAPSVAASTTSLTYDKATRQPAVADPAWELNSQLLGPLSRRHEFLLLRKLVAGVPDVGAGWSFFDVGMVEYSAGEAGRGEDMAVYARTAAYRRPIRYWLAAPSGEQRGAALREMLHRGLPYAIYPHLLPEAPKYRDLYVRFLPVTERLSRAGWEPVTLALCEDADLRLERYGRLGDANLCFALRNVGADRKTARLILDPALGHATKVEGLEAWDLFSGRRLEPVMDRGRIALPVKLKPGEATALSVLPRAQHLQRALLEAAEAVDGAVPPCREELTYQPDRPARLILGDGPAEANAVSILRDGWATGQGLAWPPGRPLTLKLDLNSLHRLQWLRVHYGSGEGYAVSPATLEGCDREGVWRKLGALPAGGAAGLSPIMDITDQGEYQLLRLSYPALHESLWISEIEVHGQDAALVRAAQRFRTLAAQSDFDDLGVVSQLAIALRVRRMVGHDKTLQEQALTHLASFCSVAGGIEAAIAFPDGAPEAGSVTAQLVMANRGTQALREGAVKLKLPPGWSAAPGKFEVNLPPGQTVRLPVTLVRAPQGGQLTVLVTGLIGSTALFMSQQR